MIDKRLLTVNDLVKATNIGKTNWYAMIASGEIPCIRLGKKILVDSRQLDAWINKKTEEAQISGN